MSSMIMPQEVLDAIQKLDDTDQGKQKAKIPVSSKRDCCTDTKHCSTSLTLPTDAVFAYIDKLKAIIDEKEAIIDEKDAELLAFKDSVDAAPAEANAEPMETEETDDDVDFPLLYESGDDYEKAAEHKMKASDLKMEGKLDEALEEYTLAIQAAPPSALLYANRAMVLLELERYKAAEHDCNEALKENPDSAKALRVRGKALKAMGEWERSLHDLSASQTIDFDEGTVEDLKEVSEKVKEIEHKKVEEKLEKEVKLKKRAEEIKEAQENAKKEKSKSRSSPSSSSRSSSGFGGGMPGGMAGMGGIMEMLQSDPEMLAAMQNPKVMAAFSEMMSGGAPDPAKMQSLMADPEVGPILQKLMAKIGGAMGGGGMPGGGGGFGGAEAAGGGNDDEIPDIAGDDGDFDDLPDLE